MKKIVLFLAIGLALPLMAQGANGVSALETVARHYAATQPELRTYEVTLQTSKLAQVLENMTASMPPDLPRPSVPQLRKYVSRAQGGTVVRAEGQKVFPYMQEMVARFSNELAIELRTLFLPMAAVEARQTLLENARVKSSETRLGESRTLTVEVGFPAPTELNGAFYQVGLNLPQSDIKGLAFDLDPDLNLLKRLEITTASGQMQTVELRHRLVEGGYQPREIRITTPDGSIDDHVSVTFGKVQGYWLPLTQVRTIRRPGRAETITVTFSDYRLNVPLPEQVLEQMKPSR